MKVLAGEGSSMRRPLVGLLLLLLLVKEAWAFNFTPTEVEWARWPYYCQAMYARLDVAKENGYWKRIPKNDAEKWFRIGDSVGGAWHYCGGLTRLDRADASTNPEQRRKYYREVIPAVMFSYDRTDASSPWMAKYAVALARAYRGLGEFEKAIGFLNESIRNHPGYTSAHALLSLIYMEQGKYDDAESVLLAGDVAAESMSSEIAYFLGQVYFKKGNFDLARQHADRAQVLGYPLTGLHKLIEEAERSSIKKKQ